jgi:hypothetical protein
MDLKEPDKTRFLEKERKNKKHIGLRGEEWESAVGWE